MDSNKLKGLFLEKFGRECRLFFSPGRINLIGEHTDYNAGFVFPGAVDKGITLAIAPNGTDRVNAISFDMTDCPTCSFELTGTKRPEPRWAWYIFGVCKELESRGFRCSGFDTMFYGNIPFGAGMSSSAALDCAYAYALNTIFFDGRIDRFEIARIGQSTENNWCGLKCGIMDQFASVFGKKDRLMCLDCRALEYTYYPFDPAGYSLVLVDSCVKHALGSEYNERRESCENAVAAIATRHPEVKALRDATHEMLFEARGLLSDTDYNRAVYILDEKNRVLEVCRSLEKGDYENVGRCMYSTHRGFSLQFQASCPETDFLVEVARECGVTGSRIMGGGFGGCTINLVKDSVRESFTETASRKYRELFSIEPKVYSVSIGDGSHEIS